MAKVIGVAARKGGVGKSTVSVNLAMTLALAGHRTLLIDSDEQGSCLQWAAAREEPPPFGVMGLAVKKKEPRKKGEEEEPTAKLLLREVARLRPDYDCIVIDTPPLDNGIARAAIISSDVVLVPCAPGQFDVWGIGETVQIVTEAQILKPELRAGIVFNKNEEGTTLSRDTCAALITLPLPLLDTKLGQRVAFGECIGPGQSIHDTRDRKAQAEWTGLMNDVERLSA